MIQLVVCLESRRRIGPRALFEEVAEDERVINDICEYAQVVDGNRPYRLTADVHPEFMQILGSRGKLGELI
jgi:hypothetical protein